MWISWEVPILPHSRGHETLVHWAGPHRESAPAPLQRTHASQGCSARGLQCQRPVLTSCPRHLVTPVLCALSPSSRCPARCPSTSMCTTSASPRPACSSSPCTGPGPSRHFRHLGKWLFSPCVSLGRAFPALGMACKISEGPSSLFLWPDLLVKYSWWPRLQCSSDLYCAFSARPGLGARSREWRGMEGRSRPVILRQIGGTASGGF